ncbi:MAG: hypothetical protein KIS62_03600 [Ramlibacter sp.]|nr:hypothetical protein [Ramlibacter sp.]MCW5648810.1 hypothetical protein [Ramlibacter sp.]
MSRTRKNHGVSLIITLIMLVVIGLTAASAMRGAASSERVTNSLRMQNLAQQYAESALRYCESQISLADAARVPTLKEASIVSPAGSTPDWQVTATWVGAAVRTTTVPVAQIRSSDSSTVPTTLPQCFAERSTLADGTPVTLITARGFSPDYSANATTGATLAGSVAWLQSVVALN